MGGITEGGRMDAVLLSIAFVILCFIVARLVRRVARDRRESRQIDLSGIYEGGVVMIQRKRNQYDD